jgi:hypothetical protein
MDNNGNPDSNNQPAADNVFYGNQQATNYNQRSFRISKSHRKKYAKGFFAL